MNHLSRRCDITIPTVQTLLVNVSSLVGRVLVLCSTLDNSCYVSRVVLFQSIALGQVISYIPANVFYLSYPTLHEMLGTVIIPSFAEEQNKATLRNSINVNINILLIAIQSAQMAEALRYRYGY